MRYRMLIAIGAAALACTLTSSVAANATTYTPASRPAPTASPRPGNQAPALARNTCDNLGSYALVDFAGQGVWDLHGHAHLSPITVGIIQTWNEVNAQRWTNLNNQIVCVFELQVANLCINQDHDRNLTLGSCIAGDKNELFWRVSAGTGCGGGCALFWFINVQASEDVRSSYMFMTSTGDSENDIVNLQPSGAGNAAIWALS